MVFAINGCQGRGYQHSGTGTLSPGMLRVAEYTVTPVFASTPWALISGFLPVPACYRTRMWWRWYVGVVHGGGARGGGTRGYGGGQAWLIPGGVPWYGSGLSLAHCNPLYYSTGPL